MPAGRARIVVLCAALVGVFLPWTGAAAGVPVIAVDGRGWGHGVGMAQDGALEMGRQGASLGRILGQFYAGVSFGQDGGDVRVPVLTGGPAPASAQVTFPDGGQVTDARSGQASAGFPMDVPAGGVVTLAWDGSTYSATESGDTPGPAASAGPAQQRSAGAATTTTAPRGRAVSATTTVPGAPILPTVPTTQPGGTTTTTRPGTTTTTAPPSGPSRSARSARTLWAVPVDRGTVSVPGRGRSYRGVIEASGVGGALRLINQVDVETYLVGMGEVRNPSWPLPSLEAQEVAARTYALRAMAAGGELCDDTRCQVYLGADAEYPAAARAVQDTAGQVLVSDGRLVDAVYSANAAGYTASAEEGFGTSGSGFPYLRPAPYPTSDQMPWTVRVASKDVAARFGLHGSLTNILVSGRGSSGRAMAVTLTAGDQTTTVSGLAFAAQLGLRSTMIDAIRPEVAAVAPPPPEASILQVPPDMAATVAATPPSAAGRTVGGLAVEGPGLAPFAAGPLPVSRPAGVPLVLILLATALLAVTGAAALSSRPSRRRA